MSRTPAQSPQATNNSANAPVTQLTLVRRQLMSDAMRTQLQHALPSQVPVDKFVRSAITVINQTPDLLKCQRDSLFGAILTSAILGLMAESVLGEAYFIPFKGRVQLQIGYKGLLKLARNTGEIASIDSGVIHQYDEWSYTQGDAGEFWVKPNFLGDRGKPIIAWCVIRLKSGEIQRELVPFEEIERIRLASPSGNSPAWKSHWESMARKVVIKRALKYAPSSPELVRAVTIDEAPDRGQVAYLNADGESMHALDAPEPAAQTAGQAEPAEPAKRTPPKTTRAGSKRAAEANLDALADEVANNLGGGEVIEQEPEPEPEFEPSFHDGEYADGPEEGDTDADELESGTA